MVTLAFWAFLLSVVSFSVIPAFILAPELLSFTFFNIGALVIGFCIFKILPSAEISLPIATKAQVAILFAIFIFLEAITGFDSFLSLKESSVDDYLNTSEFSSASNIFKLLSDAVKMLLIVAIFSRVDISPKISSILYFITGVVTAGISRSQFVTSVLFSFLAWKKGKIKIGSSIFIFIILSLVFYAASASRGDINASPLDNVFFTAIAYPILNFKYLYQTGVSENIILFIQQIAIKPIPGFAYNLFGLEKEIFSYNVELTQIVSGSAISSNQPISVFTSSSIYFFFESKVGVMLVTGLLYGLFFIFLRTISQYKVYSLYLIFLASLLHRSSILDVVSFFVISLYLIVFLKVLFEVSRKYE
tara:strand:- start:10873 stop:11955 length:1083 start_codon:yes stop_codon:yes gene_type:complete